MTVLVLAHRDELISQAVSKITMVAPHLRVGVVQGDRHDIDGDVIVASVQSLAQPHRLHSLPPIDIIIVDEAHHALAPTYQRILSHVRAGEPDGAFLLGVTATPDRGDGKGLVETFDEIVYELPLLDLIDQRYLVEPYAKRVAYKADFSGLKAVAGDISESSAERIFLQGKGPAAVAATLHKHATGRKSLVFVPGVKSAHDTATTCTMTGLRATAVDGSTPIAERRAIFRAFHNGELDVLVNCGIATEGYDEPSINCVVLARPTMSRALYAQMAGRGLRLHPGKEDCLLIDMAGLTGRHDLANAASLVGLLPDDLRDGEPLTEAVNRKRRALQYAGQAHAAAVELRSRDVQLFRNRPVHWTTAGDRFATSTGHSQVVLRPDDRDQDRWTVVERLHDKSTRILRGGITLELAQGIAEEHVRATGKDILTDPNAAWLIGGDPPSEKQRYLLRKFRIPYTEGMTKGQAYDLIAAAMAQQVA